MKNFYKELTSDIEERSRAIFIIERVFFTNRYAMSSEHKDVVLLHTIPMLYSIWEGFIQNSFQLYIDFLNRQCIKCSDLNESLMLSFLEKSFPQFKSYPDKKDKRINFLNKLSSFFSENKTNIPRNIDTKNNVGFEALNGLLEAYSLAPFPERWKQYDYPKQTLKVILKSFLTDRNNIAHGGNISSSNRITHKDFEKYKNLVLFLLYEIEEKFINGISKLSHIRNENDVDKLQMMEDALKTIDRGGSENS